MENVYQAPQSEVNQDSNERAATDVFSMTARIGRVRYLAYSAGSYFLFALIVGAIMGIGFAIGGESSQGVGILGGLFSIIVGILYFFIYFVVMRRRLHDLNKSGWMGLLSFVPFLNIIFLLYLIFAPGTPSENQYGKRPPVNTALTWIGGLVFPIIMVAGILSAVAIPAYQQYVEEARAAQALGE